MRLLVALLVMLTLATFASAKGFSVQSAYGEYTVQNDGTVHVRETIKYQLSGCENDKFRELYLRKPADLKISNARGWCEGARCKFRIDEPHVSATGDRELINEIVGGGCGGITAHFEYDAKAINMYNDTAQLYYIVWGDKWGVSAPLEVVIKLPGSAALAEYYIHHPGIVQPEASISGKEIRVKSAQSAGELLEVNVLMPTSWFSPDGDYYYNYDIGRADIIRKEREVEAQLFWGRIMQVLAMVCALGLIIMPVALVAFAYVRYGREIPPEEVGYNALYEREPPSNHSPAQALMFLVGDELDEKNLQNAISATIMSLVDKGYFDIEEDDGKKVMLVLRESSEGLHNDEKEMLGFLKGKAHNGRISLETFAKDIAPAKEFYDFVNRWKATVRREFNAGKMIDSRGHDFVSGVLGSYLAVSILAIFIILMCGGTAFMLPPNVENVLGTGFCISIALALAVLGIAGIAGKMFLARWKNEGRVLNLKWGNFKKYLADFSALEEHPPASIKIWDHYMVYAIAFGVAEKTIKAIGKLAPKFVEQSRVSYFCTRPYFYSAVHTSFRPTYTPPSSRGSGMGGGHFGGGFGGGHGGGGGGAR